MSQVFLVTLSLALIVLALRSLNDLVKTIVLNGVQDERPQWWFRGAFCVSAGLTAHLVSTRFVDPYSWWIFLSLIAFAIWSVSSYLGSRFLWRACSLYRFDERVFGSGAIAAAVAMVIALPFRGFQASGWLCSISVVLGLLPLAIRTVAHWTRDHRGLGSNLLILALLGATGWFVIYATTAAFRGAATTKVVKMVKRAVSQPTPKPTTQLPKWVMGKGMHIWQLDKCVDRFGSLERLVEKMKWAGVDHLFIKTCDAKLHIDYPKTGDWMPWGDGKGDIRPYIKQLVKIAHQQGIKVYCWSFVYGEEPKIEAQLAIETLDLGVDGFFYDVEDDETAFTGGTKAAETLCGLVSEHVKEMKSDPLIGFTSNDNPCVHQKLPWVVFDKHCEVYAPQTYWRDDQYVTPSSRLKWAYASWAKYQTEVLQPAGGGRSFDHIVPVGHAYDHELNSRCTTITYEEILQFGEKVQGYWGVQWYVLDYMGEAQLQGIRDSAGGLEEKILRWQEQQKKKQEKEKQ